MDALTIILISVAVVAILAVLGLALMPRKTAPRTRRLPTPDSGALETISSPAAAQVAGTLEKPRETPRADLRETPRVETRAIATSAPAATRDLEDLSEDLRRALNAIAVMPESFDRDTARVVAECSDADIAGLVAFGALAHDASSDRYSLRERARAMCRSHLASDDAHAARLRHAAHFAKRAGSIEALQDAATDDKPGSDRALQAAELFERDLPHFVAALEFMRDAAGLERQLVDFVGSLAQTATIHLPHDDCVRWLEARLAAARVLSDRKAEGETLGQLGLAHRDAGDSRKAVECHEHAITIARELGHRQSEGRNLGNLGLACHHLGDRARAITCYQEVLEIMRALGDRGREGIALLSLGQACADNGDHRRALECFDQHLAIARETGDRRAEVVSLAALGTARAALGEKTAAIGLFEQQLQLTRLLRELPAEGNALLNLGRAHRSAGNFDQAISHLEQLAHISQLLAEPGAECHAVGQLGQAHLDAGHTSKAIECYDQQLRLARQTGDRRAEGDAHWHTALAINSRGQIGDAVTRAEVALHIFEEVEAPEAATVRDRVAKWRAQA